MNERSPGRPRSGRAREAVLDATRQLLLDPGYDRMTIEAIAARAGVGKQTIYRWWRGKAAIVAEATADMVVPDARVLRDRRGPLREDLRAWLLDVVRLVNEPHGTARIRALAAAVATDPDAADTLYRQVAGPGVEVIAARLREAQTAGEVRSEADVEAASDALAGFILFVVLTGGKVTAERLENLLDIVVTGLRTPA